MNRRINNPNIDIPYAEIPNGKFEDKDGNWWYKTPCNGKISKLYIRTCRICRKVDKGVVKRHKHTICNSCSMLGKNTGNEVGKKFDKLTVVATAGVENQESYYWAVCDCGRQCVKRRIGHLKGRNPQQCYICTSESRSNNKNKLTTRDVKKELAKEECILTSEFINSSTSFSYVCKHGLKKKSMWSNWSNGKRCGCEKSYQEMLIAEKLNDLGLKYKRNVRDPLCKNKKPLEFDFIIEDQVRVEYQGKHHYEEMRFEYGVSPLSKIQLHDKIKRDYCKENGIPFLEIPYNESDKMGMLISFLQQHNLVGGKSNGGA